MQRRNQTWIFKKPPLIVAAAAVGGERESKSPLKEGFAYLFENNRAGCESFEQAEAEFMKKACQIVMEQGGLHSSQIELMLSGDLMNQVTSSSLTARQFYLPYIGIYSACATAAAGLALGAMALESGLVGNVLTGAASHNRSAERQFRYPTEYGCQKPDTAQITACGCGMGILAREGRGVKITAATIGRVIDWGVSDAQNMGAVMAPAAVASIMTHFEDTGTGPGDYDLILTGDLGKVGHALAKSLFLEEGLVLDDVKLQDCGMLLYPPGGNNFAGGSGAGCVASVFYGHFYQALLRGEYQRILLAATGALHSPMVNKQNESIPAVSHCIALEV